LLQSLKDLLFFDVELVEVKRVDFNRDVHRVSHFDASHGSIRVGKDWSKLHGIWDEIYLVVHALTLSIDHEDLGVVFHLEVNFLGKWLVQVGSEHDINSLLLSRLQGTRDGEDLESLAGLFPFLGSGDIGLEEVLPVARYLLVVLEAHLDHLSCVNAHFLEVELTSGHSQLGYGKVGHELDGV